MPLGERLRALCDGAVPGDPGELEALLARTFEDFRSRHPAVQVADEDLLRQLARHLPPTLAALAALHLDDLLLACACVRADRAALDELEARHLSSVPRWIRRVAGVSAEDVQQNLRRRLLLGDEPRLLGYSGLHDLEGFLRIAAVRCAIDQWRATKPQKAQVQLAEDELDSLWDGPDPEVDLARLHDGAVLRELLHDAIRELPPHRRSLLRLHYLEGISLERLAVMEQVHRATAARWLAEARAGLLERVRALLAERLKLSPEEGESLLRFVRSRLEQSLQRALQSTG